MRVSVFAYAKKNDASKKNSLGHRQLKKETEEEKAEKSSKKSEKHEQKATQRVSVV